MEPLDRDIVNALQDGIPVTERPFAPLAERLGVSEETVTARLAALLDAGVLSRFGPMYDAAAMGGAFTLAAMAVPPADFDRVADIVNGYPEVAHNYVREHELNMWFVVGAEDPARIPQVLAEIRARTGLAVHDFPKQEEFYIGLRLTV